MAYANPSSYEVEHLQFREALLKISCYKKRSDSETDYQSMLSMMAVAEDAVNPLEIVASGT